jgi:hypothetical protein
MTIITIKDQYIDQITCSRDEIIVPPGWIIVPDNFNGSHGDHIDWFTKEMIRIPDEELIRIGKRFDKRGRWYHKTILGRIQDIIQLDIDIGAEWTNKPPNANEPFQKWDEFSEQWIFDDSTKKTLENMSYIGHLNPGFNIELPGFIYHYTSLDNFLRILDTKTFFMFDSNQMNDYKENYAIIDALNRVISSNIYNIPVEYLQKLNETLSFKFNIGFAFICCFTELRDSISQWRAYGDDGNGICLILNPRNFGINYELPSHNAETEKCISFHNVIYEYWQQDRIIEEILKIALHFTAENNKYKPETFAEHVCNLIGRFAPIFKINEFQEEKEWRIIYETFLLEQKSLGILTSDTRYDIGFIHTRNNIKSYFPLKIDESKFVNSVTGIIIGPKSKMTFPYMEMSTLLKTKGFGHVQIYNSNISYR